jgi:mRNA-degrading endonuclease RelE of RelBE toxin-antitoxin system
MQTVVETPSYLCRRETAVFTGRARRHRRTFGQRPYMRRGHSRERRHSVRFGFGARGKSGGARIIYLFSGEALPVFVLAVFAKNEKANISAAERNVLAKVVADMIENYRRRK